MRFRELYRASFAHINPRPELLAATRELCQKEAFAPTAPKKHRWLHQSIRAQALGLAACLVLGFGLYLGLPEDMGTTQDPANTVQMARSMPDEQGEQSEQGNQGLEAYSAAPASAPPAADKARTGAPMAAGLPADSAAGSEPRTTQESTYDCLGNYGAQYDCAGNPENVYELPLAKYAEDSGPQPLFGAELLQQAHDSSCYLIRLGLWAYRYTMFK